MGGRGSNSRMSGSAQPFDRFKSGGIDMKTYNKLPQYAKDSVLAIDSYNPREYGYNEPNNYHMFYVDKGGTVQFISEDGKDFMAEVRASRSDFGKVDDFDFPSGYK